MRLYNNLKFRARNKNIGKEKSAIFKFFLFVRKRPIYIIGWSFVLINIFLLFFAPYVAPYDPVATFTEHSRQAPNSNHWFGTDTTGMDIFSRVIYAPRINLTISVLGNFFALLIGIPFGLVTGYYRGFWVTIILRIFDVIQSFPVFVLAMVLVAVSGVSIQNVIIAIAFVQGPIYLRLIRGEVIKIRTLRYIDAAKVMANNDIRILFKHILPNSMPPAAIQFSVNLGFAVLLTAGLSFVGAGVRVPTPEWGSMISIGAPAMVTGEWWMALFPGIAIAFTVFGFALVSESLSEFSSARGGE